MIAPRVVVQAGSIDAAAETARLTSGRTDIGGLVTFTGICRDEGARLVALEIEHFPGMAEAEIGRIAADVVARWPLTGLTVVHRFGLVRPGDTIVVVAAASAHRAPALEACAFLMDFLKTRAPFWKREHLVGGAIGGWIAPKASDAAAANDWLSNSNPEVPQ